MKFWKIALSAILAVTLLGCSSKFMAPQDIQTSVANATKAQIKDGILASGAAQGKSSPFGTWKMQVINSSTIRGELFNRGYQVIVQIPYTAKGYTIKYESVSDNLKDKNGNVHRNYNRWISNLDAKIQKNIFAQK